MAYPINKVHKAHYILMNIECDQKVLNELEEAFRYNDAIIRNLIMRRNEAATGVSPIMKAGQQQDRHESKRAPRPDVEETQTEESE